MTEPQVRVTRYEVSCIPEDNDDSGVFTITVQYRGEGRWGVFRGEHRQLGADGLWSWGYEWPGGDREPATDEERDDYARGEEAWRDAHRFDLETALTLAKQAAPKLTVNGWTVDQVLADASGSPTEDR